VNGNYQSQRRAIATANTDPENVDTKTREAPNASPEAPQPPLSIVFTDIVKSTAIWEKNSTAMAEAMTIHDNLIRTLTATHNGYEVKQNGDGFMIAFQSAVPALNFCLDVQIQLQEQKWPQELLEIGPAKPVIEEHAEHDHQAILWKGLRLRMSAHFGEPVCVWNDIIRRMDYLGPAVNRAARFVSVCEGGQIVVSEDFLLELDRLGSNSSSTGDGPLFEKSQTAAAGTVLEAEDQKRLEGLAGADFEVRVLGDRQFKGVTDKQRLFFIVPKSLQGRLRHFPQHKYVQPSKGNLEESV